MNSVKSWVCFYNWNKQSPFNIFFLWKSPELQAIALVSRPKSLSLAFQSSSSSLHVKVYFYFTKRDWWALISHVQSKVKGKYKNSRTPNCLFTTYEIADLMVKRLLQLMYYSFNRGYNSHKSYWTGWGSTIQCGKNIFFFYVQK